MMNYKILGCRDPRCKHENPSIIIRSKKFNEVRLSKKKSHDKSKNVWKGHESVMKCHEKS